MARTTVEDCLEVCPNHFELTMIAAKRARKMEMSGDSGRVERDNDKPIVIALREIRAGLHLEPEEPELAEESDEQELAAGDDAEDSSEKAPEKPD